MNKFVDDTLKVNGKYSTKRVLIAVFSPSALILGFYIVVSDRLLGEKVVNPYAIQVFNGFLTFISAMVITTAYAKKAELKDSGTTSQE